MSTKTRAFIRGKINNEKCSINMFYFVLKGANASQLEKDIGSDLFPANEHFFGLVNVSIIQLIFKTARPRRLLNPGFLIIILPKSFFENF